MRGQPAVGQRNDQSKLVRAPWPPARRSLPRRPARAPTSTAAEGHDRRAPHAEAFDGVGRPFDGRPSRTSPLAEPPPGSASAGGPGAHGARRGRPGRPGRRLATIRCIPTARSAPVGGQLHRHRAGRSAIFGRPQKKKKGGGRAVGAAMSARASGAVGYVRQHDHGAPLVHAAAASTAGSTLSSMSGAASMAKLRRAWARPATHSVAVGGEVVGGTDEHVPPRLRASAAAPSSLNRLTEVESETSTSPGLAPSTPAARTSPIPVACSIDEDHEPIRPGAHSVSTTRCSAAGVFERHQAEPVPVQIEHPGRPRCLSVPENRLRNPASGSASSRATGRPCQNRAASTRECCGAAGTAPATPAMSGH